MVEKDYNYPGGFYIRHKEAWRYCIACNRFDLENMVENALAALGVNCGRVILYDDAELLWFKEAKGIIMECLDNHLINCLEYNGLNNAFLRKQFIMSILWRLIEDVRVNERAPKYELNLGKGNGKVGVKEIIGVGQQNSVISHDIINSFK